MNLLKRHSVEYYRRKIVELLHRKDFYIYTFLALLLYGIFYVNTLHESYPDEFDNILGGWYLLHGIPIYRSFFTHHGPVAYFLAALLEIISGRSFVRFRIVYSVFLFIYTVWTYHIFWKKFGEYISRFYLLLIFIIGIAATYFWAHMLLADSISGFFLMPVFGLLILSTLYKKPLVISDYTIISVLTFLSLFSSLTYLYVVGFIYLYIAYIILKEYPLTRRHIRFYSKVLAIFAIPYLIFGIYLLATNSFSDYVYQNFTFNQQYYIYNYPRPPGDTHINPVRFAIVIANNFVNNFSTLLVQVKDFNFGFPFNITLALANICLAIYLLFKRKFAAFLFLWIMLIYANARSSPLQSSETDYQSAVYIMISLFNLCFIPFVFYEELLLHPLESRKIIFSFLFILLSVYGLFTGLFLIRKFDSKVYGKYMGTAPLIYDRPKISPIINTLVSADEYTWIGPFEFEELFYTNGKLASQYQIFNPGMGHSDKIQNGLISDFETTKPKVIWFDKRFFILGENPEMYGKPFIQYLADHYITIYGYQNNGVKYIPTTPLDPRVDIETKLYIRKENFNEVIGKLIASNYIKEVPAK